MQTEWNLKLLYKSVNDPQIDDDIKLSVDCVNKFVAKWKNNKEYLKDSNALLEAIKDYESLSEHYGCCTKPMYYFSLLSYLDQTDTDIKARLNKIDNISTRLTNDLQFFFLNISKVSKKQQKLFLQSPILSDYKHLLECLFASSKYLLSDKEERIFNLVENCSFSNWVDMVSTLLDKQKFIVIDDNRNDVEITYNEISKFLDSRNKDVRDFASVQFNKVNSRYLEVAEFEMNSVLENKRVSDDCRGVSRPDLPRHLADDIDTSVVDSLVNVVSSNFDISKRYYEYKAKRLGLDNMFYYERNVPLGNIDLEFSYDESRKIVDDTFAKLDSEFYDIIKGFENNGQYDVFPKVGKVGGAFCTSVGRLLPTYILLNHVNKVDDVLTIAHESGHGVHTELSKRQSELNCGYPTSLAEVASTFFEDFALDEVIGRCSDDVKKSLYVNKMERIISTIFRQVAFYNFELELHSSFRERGYLDKDFICDLFVKHMKSYLGDSVVVDDSMRFGWVYVSHFRDFFYVYSYASGLLISKCLQEMVKSDISNVEKVKYVLSAGSIKSPKDLFMDIGIDIAEKDFWQNGIDNIRKDFSVLLS